LDGEEDVALFGCDGLHHDVAHEAADDGADYWERQKGLDG
jgi:hypothetical protein